MQLADMLWRDVPVTEICAATGLSDCQIYKIRRGEQRQAVKALLDDMRAVTKRAMRDEWLRAQRMALARMRELAQSKDETVALGACDRLLNEYSDMHQDRELESEAAIVDMHRVEPARYVEGSNGHNRLPAVEVDG